MKVILDTCVISELIAKHPDPGVVEFVDALDGNDVYLSVITIGEITKGIEKLGASRRKAELHKWLKEDLLMRFDGKIIPLDTDVLMVWGNLLAKLESKGYVMPAIDSLIAATALVHEMALVTRNVKDFEISGIILVNPWQ
jgi:tRNA(fMet)-specific endonuclease VapC